MPTHDYTFDVEGRLASVRTSNQTTTFFYDADGQRVMISRLDNVITSYGLSVHIRNRPR